MRFLGKVAIITGAANGMDASEAKIFAHEGETDVKAVKLLELAAEIKAARDDGIANKA